MFASRGSRTLVASVPLLYSRFHGKTLSASATMSAASADKSQTDIVLYQYKICPFCNRVKAYLDFNRIKYSVVEVNPLTKSELAFTKGEFKKVPVAIINGHVLGDSSAIIRAVRDANSASQSALFTADSEKWMDWSEKKLAVYLYPNITRNFAESWESFAYTSEVSSWSSFAKYSNRLLGPVAMYFANGKIKKKYGIVDERAELKAVLLEWTSSLGGKKFLHGDSITVPDLMVYGVLRAIDGFATFDEVMQSDVELKDWYQRVKTEVTLRKPA